MADISSIKINDSLYNVKDNAAREALNNKVDKVNGKGLSTEDYTTAEKTKLAGIEAGAQVNTVTGVKGSSESTYHTGNVSLSKASIGLAEVDNTSDINKPVSTAQQAALDTKVDKVAGKGLSTEDYTTAEKEKLADIDNPFIGAETDMQTFSGLSIIAEHTAAGEIDDFTLYGKSLQETTTGKNLLPVTLDEVKRLNTVGTWNGDSYTVDGRIFDIQTSNGLVEQIVVNGLGTSNARLVLVGPNFSCNSATILTGCPRGGSWNTYVLQYVYEYDDMGDGIEINAGLETSGHGSYAMVIGGYEAKNLIFKPMLRLASDTDSSYEPYTGGIPAPNPDFPIPIQTVGDTEIMCTGKNLLPNMATTQTINGVTFTVNSDGSVDVNGKNMGNSTTSLCIAGAASHQSQSLKLPVGNYILSGTPADGGSSSSFKYFMSLYYNNDMADNYGVFDFGKSASYSLTNETNKGLGVQIGIAAGATVNATFYPMLRFAEVEDAAWEPYRAVSIHIPTPNGLPGIPVDSGGNYTDESGQQWICDTIDKASGTYTQRIIRHVYRGKGENWDELGTEDTTANGYRWRCTSYIDGYIPMDNNAVLFAVCNRYQPKAANQTYRGQIGISAQPSPGFPNNGVISFYNPSYAFGTVEAWKQHLADLYDAGTPLTAIYPLAVPLTTALTSAQLASLNRLQSFEDSTSLYTTDDLQPEMSVSLGIGIDGQSGMVPVPAYEGQYLGSDGMWHAPDMIPAEGSDRLITSGAVYNVLTDNFDSLLPRLLNADNYTSMMKLWFSMNGAAVLNDFSTLCDRWYDITRTGWTGGTRFYHWPGSGSGEGTKVGDNVGMVAVPSTDTVAGRDDYQDVPLFHCLDCNWILDENGAPQITAIEGVCGNFERYNPDKLVGVIQMTGWHRYVDDTNNNVFTHMYTDEIGAASYHPLPEAVNPDGTVRTWVVHAKYASGDDYGCYSGVHPWTYTASHNSAITAFHNKWGNQYGGKTSADDAFLKLMFYLKYANLSADGVLQGCVNYNYQYAVAVQETGVERVILTAAQAANIKVGSTVMVGNPTAFSSGTTLNIDRGQAGMRAKVDRKKVTRKETLSSGNVAVYIDNGGVTFNTTANTITTAGDSPTYISTSPWYTGTCDNVKGVDGSPTSPGNGTEPVILQGIEYALGAYEIVCDSILKYYKDSSDKYHLTVYVCRDASKYSSELTSDYQLVSYEVDCPASTGWQHIAELGYDPDHPEAWFPHLIGCTSSQRTKDAIYILAASTSTNERLSLGTLTHGVGDAGLSIVNANNGLGSAWWNILARLSATGNRGTYNGGGN